MFCFFSHIYLIHYIKLWISSFSSWCVLQNLSFISSVYSRVVSFCSRSKLRMPHSFFPPWLSLIQLYLFLFSFRAHMLCDPPEPYLCHKQMPPQIALRVISARKKMNLYKNWGEQKQQKRKAHLQLFCLRIKQKVEKRMKKIIIIMVVR